MKVTDPAAFVKLTFAPLLARVADLKAGAGSAVVSSSKTLSVGPAASPAQFT